MKRRSHGLALTDHHRIVTLGGKNFDARADPLDFGCADEDHFDGCITEEALTDRAVDLASVRVAADIDVDGAKPMLLWVLDFSRKQDGTSTGTESWFQLHELFQFL